MAGKVQYIGQGRPSPPVTVSFSINKGASWKTTEVKPGQTCNVSRSATHLNIDGVPRDPGKTWRVRDGNVFEVN